MQQQTINGKLTGMNRNADKNQEQFKDKFQTNVKLLKSWKPKKASWRARLKP